MQKDAKNAKSVEKDSHLTTNNNLMANGHKDKPRSGALDFAPRDELKNENAVSLGPSFVECLKIFQPPFTYRYHRHLGFVDSCHATSDSS